MAYQLIILLLGFFFLINIIIINASVWVVFF